MTRDAVVRSRDLSLIAGWPPRYRASKGESRESITRSRAAWLMALRVSPVRAVCASVTWDMTLAMCCGGGKGSRGSEIAGNTQGRRVSTRKKLLLLNDIIK